MRLLRPAALLCVLAGPGIVIAGDKESRPKLSLRAAPRVAPAPVTVLFTAELKGGDEGEALYCPEVEWDWGDGTRTAQGGDCPPFRPGETEVQRLFEAQHDYRGAGRPTVQLRILKEGKVVTRAQVSLIVGPPYQKPRIEYRGPERPAGESRSRLAPPP